MDDNSEKLMKGLFIVTGINGFIALLSTGEINIFGKLYLFIMVLISGRILYKELYNRQESSIFEFQFIVGTKIVLVVAILTAIRLIIEKIFGISLLH